MTEGLERNEMKRNSQSWSFPKDRHGSFEIFLSSDFFQKKVFVVLANHFFSQVKPDVKKGCLDFPDFGRLQQEDQQEEGLSQTPNGFSVMSLLPSSNSDFSFELQNNWERRGGKVQSQVKRWIHVLVKSSSTDLEANTTGLEVEVCPHQTELSATLD